MLSVLIKNIPAEAVRPHSIKMQSHQYVKSHFGDRTILWLPYLHNGISYTGNMTSLYWIRALICCLSWCWRCADEGQNTSHAPRCHCANEYSPSMVMCRENGNSANKALERPAQIGWKIIFSFKSFHLDFKQAMVWNKLLQILLLTFW